MIHIAEDIYTPGPLDTEHRWSFIKDFLPRDLKEMRVLDVGCNAGFYSFKMRELGAEYVLGIDFEHYIKQACFIKDLTKTTDVDFEVNSIYSLSTPARFNITLCLGLLYHLKYPFLALQKISQLTTDMILVETEALVGERDTDKMQYIEHTYKNDGTNWWIFGEQCLRGMLRSVGFTFVKSYSYPSYHPIFGSHYSQGLTEEGIPKGKRIVVVGLKRIDYKRLGMLVSESSDLEKEIDLDNLQTIE